MGIGIITIAHAVLAVFVIIELGLTAYCVDANWGWSDRINFMLFNSVWSILVLAYLALAPLFLAAFYITVAAVAILLITVIFWFAGSIALAVAVGAPHCGDNSYCSSLQAATAFGFFIWVGFTALAVLETLAFLRSRGHSAHADTTKPGAQVYAA